MSNCIEKVRGNFVPLSAAGNAVLIQKVGGIAQGKTIVEIKEYNFAENFSARKFHWDILISDQGIELAAPEANTINVQKPPVIKPRQYTCGVLHYHDITAVSVTSLNPRNPLCINVHSINMDRYGNEAHTSFLCDTGEEFISILDAILARLKGSFLTRSPMAEVSEKAGVAISATVDRYREVVVRELLPNLTEKRLYRRIHLADTGLVYVYDEKLHVCHDCMELSAYADAGIYLENQ